MATHICGMLDIAPHYVLDEDGQTHPGGGAPQTGDAPLLDAYSRTVSDVVDTVGPSVVRIDLARDDGKPAGSGSGVIVWPAGARNSLHQMCHDEAAPQPTVHATVVYTMERLADFLNRLKQIPEGDGNLLDHCSILCTTELSEGNVHSNDEFPILIAGKGSGRLKGDWHHRGRGKPNTSHAVLTALRAGGVPAPTFGDGPGLVGDSIGELEA